MIKLLRLADQIVFSNITHAKMFQLSFISFLSLLSLVIVQADLKKSQPSHVTGAVRIKRSSIPDPFIRCISENGVNNADGCPRRIGNWSDFHCRNNSFGLYTPQSQFMNLGAGPLGINLNDGFLQYLSYLPARDQRQFEKEEAISKKIEKLIEEKAKFEMKVRFYDTHFDKLEKENDMLRKHLEAAKEQIFGDSATIHSLSTRLTQWEEGSAECRSNMESEKKKLSAALEIASSHISQLEKENVAYMDTNKRLSETVRTLQNSCAITKASVKDCSTQLSECKTKLEMCAYSEREAESSLEKQTQLHKEHVARAESEYSSIHNLLGLAREELAECAASVDETRTRNNELQKSRDTYISRLSKQITLLKQCNDDLQNCNANHSVSSSLHVECRSEISKFSNRFNHMQDQYMKCKNDLDDIRVEQKRLNEKNMELNMKAANKTLELEQLIHQKRKLEERVSEMVEQHGHEASHHKETKAALFSCQKQLRNMTELSNRQKFEISVINKFLDQLTTFKGDCVKKNDQCMKDVNVVKSMLKKMEGKLNECQKQLHNYDTENGKILSIKTSCQGELSALKKMHAVILQQNHECLTKHNASIQSLGDWKNQYIKCNGEVRNLTADVLECEAKKNFLGEMIKSLEQEAEVSLRTNKNLELRVSKQATIISELTLALTKADSKADDMQTEHTELGDKLKEQQTAYQIKVQQYMDCSNNYSRSLEKINELQQNELFNTELLDSTRKQAKETSNQLMETEKTLADKEAVLQKALNDILGLRTRLNTAQELHDNEREGRLALNIQLQQCKGNHTETRGESYSWQLKLESCRKHMSQIIATHEKDLQEVEARLKDLTKAYEREIEAHRQMNASFHQCQKQQGAMQGEQENLQHRVSECAQKVSVYIQRIQHFIHLKMLLQQKFDTCSSESGKCRQLLQIQKSKFYRCEEQIQAIQLELEFTRTQLEQCNKECKKSSLACPEGPAGETYVITSSGCLMQTSVSGSEKEMKQYCIAMKGKLVPLQTSGSHFNKDIIQMLEYSGEKATVVWVLPPHQSKEECYSADMSTVTSNLTRPLEYSKTRCDKQLPGVCFASLHEVSSSQSGTDTLLSGMGMMDTMGSSLADIDSYGIDNFDFDMQFTNLSSSAASSSSNSWP